MKTQLARRTQFNLTENMKEGYEWEAKKKNKNKKKKEWNVLNICM